MPEQTDFVRRPLGRESNDELVELFRACPIVADFTICFDRHPDFFRFPELVFDSYGYEGIFLDDRLVGCVMLAKLTGWMDRERGFGTYCYAGDGRALAGLRAGRKVANTTVELLRERSDDAPIALGLIKEGNEPAAYLAKTTTPHDFEFRTLTGFEAANIILMRRARRDLGTRVRRASERDIPELADVMARAFEGRLFAPLITAETLERDTKRLPGLGIEQYYVAERNGRIVGALGAWDMGAFKRTVVVRYSALGRAMKAAYRAGRLLFRRAAPLPGPNEALREVTITRMAIPDRDPLVLRDLIAAAGNDALDQGAHMMHVGFVGNDRLREATKRFFVQRFRSTLWVGWQRGSAGPDLTAGADPYVDIAII